MLQARYLPFSEAREYVQRLGFQSKRQWREWSKAGLRPAFIPSAPEKVYGSEFEGIPEFLGYERKRRASQSFSPGAIMAKHQASRREGIVQLHDHLLEHAPDFEFEPFANDSSISFLTRPRQHNSGPAGWTPFAVRIASKICGRPNSIVTNFSIHPDCIGVFALDIHRNDVYFFPREEKFPQNLTLGENTKYCRYRVGIADLSGTLQQYYERGLYASPVDWLERGCQRNQIQHRLWKDSVARVWRLIYEPLHLRVQFRPQDMGMGSNILIDGVPTLHRVGSQCKRTSRSDRLVVNLTKASKSHGGIFTHAIQDAFKFLIVIVHDKVEGLRGVYVFPKQFLDKHRVIGDADKKLIGVHNFYLYPPGAFLQNEKMFQQNAWKNNFFVDFSSEEDAKEKFLEIFNKYRDGRVDA